MKIRRKVNMSKVNENWIGWNYKSRPDEIIELVLDEVNDMLKKSKIKINYQYNDDNEEGWDYFLELTKEYNGKEI
jgi:hypothetical protein